MGWECSDDGWARGGKPSRLGEVIHGAAGLRGCKLHGELECYQLAMDCTRVREDVEWKQASERAEAEKTGKKIGGDGYDCSDPFRGRKEGIYDKGDEKTGKGQYGCGDG